MEDPNFDPPNRRSPSSVSAVARIAGEITARRRSGPTTLVLAIDGRSGAGKSTLAAAVAEALRRQHDITATVIEGDHFYAGGSGESWDACSASEKADRVIDWRTQRGVLEDVLEHGTASWFPFDWTAPDWDAEPAPHAAVPMTCDAADVLILEGAYSARPELHDLLDVRVLLDPPTDQRRHQLLEREGDAYRDEWEGRWSVAEDHYFGTIMTPDRFDLVL